MAEPSEISPQSGKQRTRKTKKLIPGLALQALEDVIIECQQAGISARAESFFENGVHGVVIVLANVAIDYDNHLYQIASTGNEDMP